LPGWGRRRGLLLAHGDYWYTAWNIERGQLQEIINLIEYLGFFKRFFDEFLPQGNTDRVSVFYIYFIYWLELQTNAETFLFKWI
jgi:hypothetical protein